MMRWMVLILAGALVWTASAASPYAASLASAAGKSVVAGSDGWLFLPAELRFLSQGVFWGDAAGTTGVAPNAAHRDPLPAIEDFAHQLEAMNVKLLVVPVPPKALVYAERLGLSDEAVAAGSDALSGFYSELRARGVPVVDLLGTFRARREETALYCRTDTHWTSAGIRIAAEAIAQEMRLMGWDRKQAAPGWWVTEREARITGDLTRMAGGSDVEPLSIGVVYNEGGGVVTTRQDSTVLLLGDSHTLVFSAGGDMHATGAGLPEHLSMQVGKPVDALGVRGSGATTSRISLMRRMRADPAYIKGKWIVVWCFAARDFTEADGWRLVPLNPVP